MRPLSELDPDHLRQRLMDLGNEWADQNAAADILEETKKTVLAEVMSQCNAKSRSEREDFALNSEIYRDHLVAMVEARRKANRARVAFDSAKTWNDLARTLEATNRAQMGMR